MQAIKFIKHSDLTQQLEQQIISIKSVAWPYTFNDQQNWMNENLNNHDLHVLLSDNQDLIAYLNLIQVEIEKDGRLYSAFGIGNVCAREKGKGWGKELLRFVNAYLKENWHFGILFCREALVKFYSENGWAVVPEEYLKIENGGSHIYCMVNSEVDFQCLKYEGKLF